jgi:hypothetical protein
MQRLFLHLRSDDNLIRDDEGCLFADLEDAKTEALATGREMIADWVGKRKKLGTFQIEVQDQEGQVLAVMPLREMLD